MRADILAELLIANGVTASPKRVPSAIDALRTVGHPSFTDGRYDVDANGEWTAPPQCQNIRRYDCDVIILWIIGTIPVPSRLIGPGSETQDAHDMLVERWAQWAAMSRLETGYGFRELIMLRRAIWEFDPTSINDAPLLPETPEECASEYESSAWSREDFLASVDQLRTLVFRIGAHLGSLEGDQKAVEALRDLYESTNDAIWTIGTRVGTDPY